MFLQKREEVLILVILKENWAKALKVKSCKVVYGFVVFIKNQEHYNSRVNSYALNFLVQMLTFELILMP